MTKPTLTAVVALFVVMILSSCGPTQLYNWKDYENASYNYVKKSDEASLNKLLASYENIINATHMRGVPPPGVYADYGYLLIKKGEIKKGLECLKLEISIYPESKPFIERIIKRVEPSLKEEKK